MVNMDPKHSHPNSKEENKMTKIEALKALKMKMFHMKKQNISIWCLQQRFRKANRLQMMKSE